MFNIKVDDSKVTLFIDFSSRRMVQAVKTGIRIAGDDTAKYVKTRYLTGGTTPDRLGVRTGTLRKSAHSLVPMESGDRVIGGTGLGGSLVYANVHINRQSTRTTITPKHAKNLAVPFRGWGSRTGAIGYGWQKQSSPLNYPKGFLVPFKSKKGNLFLVHKTWSRGTKGRTGGKKGAGGKYAYGGKCTIEPYFMLLKSVVVPARVFPEWIARHRRPFIVSTIKNEMVKVFARKKP